MQRKGTLVVLRCLAAEEPHVDLRLGRPRALAFRSPLRRKGWAPGAGVILSAPGRRVPSDASTRVYLGCADGYSGDHRDASRGAAATLAPPAGVVMVR